MSDSKQRVRQLLYNKDAQMQSILQETRKKFQHSGGKGSAAEEALRKLLGEYLPKRLDIGHGEIVDSSGNISKETDVVIVTEDHPLTRPAGEHGLFFIEGVAAAGEVKIQLNKEGVKDSISKALALRKLQQMPPTGTLITSNESDIKRFYKSPPYFVFAYETSYTLENLTEVINSVFQEKQVTERTVDAFFVLGKGWFIDFGDGLGAYRFSTDEGRTSQKGWVSYPESEGVLLDLISWLSAVMPKMITFGSILPPYLTNIIR